MRTWKVTCQGKILGSFGGGHVCDVCYTFKQRRGQAFAVRKDGREEEAGRRETRGLQEGVLALLTGQVRGRVSTDLEISGMVPSPTIASAWASLTKERCNHFPKAIADLVLCLLLLAVITLSLLQLWVCEICPHGHTELQIKSQQTKAKYVLGNHLTGLQPRPPLQSKAASAQAEQWLPGAMWPVKPKILLWPHKGKVCLPPLSPFTVTVCSSVIGTQTFNWTLGVPFVGRQEDAPVNMPRCVSLDMCSRSEISGL